MTVRDDGGNIRNSREEGHKHYEGQYRDNDVKDSGSNAYWLIRIEILEELPEIGNSYDQNRTNYEQCSNRNYGINDPLQRHGDLQSLSVLLFKFETWPSQIASVKSIHNIIYPVKVGG